MSEKSRLIQRQPTYPAMILPNVRVPKPKKNHELPEAFMLYIAMALNSLGYFRNGHYKRHLKRVRFIEHNVAQRHTEVDGVTHSWNSDRFAGGFRTDDMRFWRYSKNNENKETCQGLILNVSCHPDHPEEMEHILFAVVKCLYMNNSERNNIFKPKYPFKFVPDKSAFDRQYHPSKHRGVVKIFMPELPPVFFAGVLHGSPTREYYGNILNEIFQESIDFGRRLDAEIATLIDRNLVTPYDAYNSKAFDGVKKIGKTFMVGLRFGSFYSDHVMIPINETIYKTKDDPSVHIPAFFRSPLFLSVLKKK